MTWDSQYETCWEKRPWITAVFEGVESFVNKSTRYVCTAAQEPSEFLVTEHVFSCGSRAGTNARVLLLIWHHTMTVPNQLGKLGIVEVQ